MAGGLDERAAVLRRLLASLVRLESEMIFACLPMREALQRTAASAEGEVGIFLADVAARVGEDGGESLASVWTKAVSRHALEMLLTRDETETLIRLGTVLGGSDREDQRKHLEMARLALDRAQADAQAQAAKDKKVWRYLGFSVGALIAVLLY